jgi:hypothetical protein
MTTVGQLMHLKVNSVVLYRDGESAIGSNWENSCTTARRRGGASKVEAFPVATEVSGQAIVCGITLTAVGNQHFLKDLIIEAGPESQQLNQERHRGHICDPI